ncbi:hypothetical protein ABEF95_000439 [Exophiala dermatitidis]
MQRTGGPTIPTQEVVIFITADESMDVRQARHGPRPLRSTNDTIHRFQHVDPSAQGLLFVPAKAGKRDGITTTYIVMERIRGETLASAWPTLAASSRDKILLQLRHFVDEMRSLPAPKREHKISNVGGGSLWDCRLVSGVDRFGPFKDPQAFHLFLRNGLEKAPSPEVPEVDEMIKLQARDWGPVVFTHGDLSSLNILVQDDNIVGIVDWETAGWYPPYWEYTTACQVNFRNMFWADWIDEFLEPWPDALKMERVRQRWWGVI